MALQPDIRAVTLAHFKIDGGDDITVHFNPASLQYSVSNTMGEAKGPNKKQYVANSSAKLTMDLVFDTTHNGHDVRELSDRMAKLMKPDGPKGKQVPPQVTFEWGTYKFTGMVEQYKETLDYFSPEGVPLRCGINLTLASQDKVFADKEHAPAASVDAAPTNAPPVMVPAGNSPGSPNPASVANQLGQPRAARDIASANGSASLRFADGGTLAVGGAGVTLNAAAAFSTGASASAGFGFGVGAGASAGAGAGFSLSAGAGAGAGLGASAGAGFSFGASAGASAGATAGTSLSLGTAASGAFAGLRVDVPPAPSLSLNGSGAVLNLTAGGSARGLSAGISAGASIGVGGQAQAGGGAGLTAQVDIPSGLRASINFEG
ncbi:MULTISPECIES: hypothetical protein [unclassified Variovorax]|uniref:CIS tube protein n=1 Tax=unclassified Variovorax TaxID=663243 RepID=UPI001BD34CB9|nr:MULTISPECIES: hypothetical protein [unclassified Variovorax]